MLVQYPYLFLQLNYNKQRIVQKIQLFDNLNNYNNLSESTFNVCLFQKNYFLQWNAAAAGSSQSNVSRLYFLKKTNENIKQLKTDSRNTTLLFDNLKQTAVNSQQSTVNSQKSLKISHQNNKQSNKSK